MCARGGTDRVNGDSEQAAALVRAAQRGDGMAMHDLLDLLAPYVGRICGPIAWKTGRTPRRRRSSRSSVASGDCAIPRGRVLPDHR